VFSAGIVAVLVSGLGQEFLSLPELRLDPAAAESISPELRADLLDRLNTLEVFGPFTISNAMAAAGLIMFFPFAALALFRKGRARPVFFALAVCALAAILLTRSKGGILALAFGIALLGAFVLREKGYSAKRVWGSFALAVPIGALALGAMIGFRPDGPFAASADVRYGYYAGAVEIVKRSPMVGIGPDMFADVYPAVKSATAGETRHVHNDFLEVAVESGLVGLLLFLVAVILILRAGFRARSLPDEAIAQPRNSEPETALDDKSRASVLAAVCSTIGLTIGLVVFGASDFDNILGHVLAGDVLWHGLLVLTTVAPPVAAWLVARHAAQESRLADALNIGLVVGVVSFLVHSLIDFNLYNEGARLVLFAGLGMMAPWAVTSNRLARLPLFAAAVLCIAVFLLAQGVASKKETTVFLHSFAALEADKVTDEEIEFLLSTLPARETEFLDPPELHFEKGMLALKLVPKNKAFLEIAAGNFLNATMLNPARGSYHVELGNCLRLMGREEEALRAFETAEELGVRNRGK
jgi:hypothetical protein